jgi:hypothetical protein
MAQALFMANGNQEQAGRIAMGAGALIQKGGVGATTEADLAGSFAASFGGEFLQSLEGGPGVFDTIRSFTRRAKYRTPFFIGGPMAAEVVGEGLKIPVFKYSVDSGGLVPVKVCGIGVGTNEALKTQEGAAALVQELRQAVIIETDRTFLSILADDAATVEAAVADPLSSLYTILGGVNLSGFGALYWALGPQLANFLSTCRAVMGGNLLFPDMGPRGGSLLGLPALVSEALVSDLMLIEPSGIVTGADDLQVKLSTSALVEMDDDPEDSGATPHQVSLFMTDSAAFLGIRTFAAKLMRPSAVGILTNAISAWENYGSGESESGS